MGSHASSDAPPKILWQGTLERGGRRPEPFIAEIVEHDGRLAILERRGLSVFEVSPPLISGASWLRAMAELAKKAA